MVKTSGKNEYLKNIFTIAGGVFVTQLLTVVISPFLTRIYDPEIFGMVAAFFSLVNVFAVIFTLRYENVIVIAGSELEAKNILKISLLNILFFSGLTTLIFFFLININLLSFFSRLNASWFFYIPIFTALNSLFFVFRNWLVRKKSFRLISTAGIYKSLSLNSILIIGGIISPRPDVFLFANLVAQSLETFYLYYRINKLDVSVFRDFNFKSILIDLKKYKNFPKYSLPADLINVYTSQNPIILLTVFYDLSVVGFFSITQRILGIPIKLISSSTLEVYKQKASEDFVEKGDCREAFLKTFKYLGSVALIPAILIYFLSPILFKIVFGEEWIQAGLFAKYLSIMFFFQFTISPLGFTLLIAGKQVWNLFWQVGLLFVTTFCLYVGFLNHSVDLSIFYFSIGYAVMYILYFIISFKASKP